MLNTKDLQNEILKLKKENEDLKKKFGLYDAKDGYSVLYFNLSGLMGLITIWHKNNYDKTVSEMAELVVRLMAKPII